MIPYTNELGLRDWRHPGTRLRAPRRRWPWVVLAIVVLGVAGAWRL